MYRTFKRSARNWQQFASARKITEERGLTYEFNANLSTAQQRKCTKLEFERE